MHIYILDLIYKKEGYQGTRTKVEENKEFPSWTKLQEEVKKKAPAGTSLIPQTPNRQSPYANKN